MIGRGLAERAYYHVCLALGWLLRSVRYSKVRIVSQDGELRVGKRRVFCGPLLVWMSKPLMRILDTGVHILPQREWEEREREIYRRLRGMSFGSMPTGCSCRGSLERRWPPYWRIRSLRRRSER